MVTYVIGDVHGSDQGVSALLDKIDVQRSDGLYFLGDMVGKGENDWGVLSRVSSIPQARVVLGNHDLHFLKEHHDAYEQGALTEMQRRGYEWLLGGTLASFHSGTNTLLVHAGIWPDWSLQKVLMLSSEVEVILRDRELLRDYFAVFYGNEDCWSDELTGWPRVRAIINVLTRMRMLSEDCRMDFHFTGKAVSGQVVEQEGTGRLIPWFDARDVWPCRYIIFGHWAQLNGETGRSDCINIDKGFVYGGSLVAMILETGQQIEVGGGAGW